MELKSVTISGFKRFGQEAFFRTDGKLIALVGANEAGKTSVLSAISRHARGNQFLDGDASRFSDNPAEVTLAYFLSQEDVDAAGLTDPCWLIVSKDANNTQDANLIPRPKRNLEPREQASRSMKQIFDQGSKPAIDADPWSTDLEALKEILASQDGFTNQQLVELNQTLAEIRLKIEEMTANIEEVEDPSLDIDPAKLDYRNSLIDLETVMADLLEFEDGHDPHADALASLMARRPEILEFSSEDRGLGLPFAIRSIRHTDPNQRKFPSKPLSNLMDAVDLDLEALVDADIDNDIALTRGMIVDANERLKELGKDRWRQSDALIEFSLDKSQLNLLVVHGPEFEAKYRYNTIAERSEGYRQFIALQIFSLFHDVEDAILLIDEMEQHLHYDAQANLVQMLTSEPRLGKVIYATHSVGCLPEDLGTGVKLVQWNSDDQKQSRIIDRFWGRGRTDGFSPLLFGMGATTLSFFPMRRALIGEGITETLLLPRLMKEASKAEYLDFQIVHGLSNLSPTGVPMIDSATNRVAFLIDNDEGGRAIRDSFSRNQNLSDRFQPIGSEKDIITLEDFIEESVWLEAVETLRSEVSAKKDPIDPIKKAPPKGRIAALPEALRKRKVDLAYAVLDVAFKDPSRPLVAPGQVDGLIDLHRRIRKALSLS